MPYLRRCITGALQHRLGVHVRLVLVMNRDLGLAQQPQRQHHLQADGAQRGPGPHGSLSCGKGARPTAGWVSTARRLTHRQRRQAHGFDGVMPAPGRQNVSSCRTADAKPSACFLVGVGRGSVIHPCSNRWVDLTVQSPRLATAGLVHIQTMFGQDLRPPPPRCCRCACGG
jgi:hypothetical protein